MNKKLFIGVILLVVILIGVIFGVASTNNDSKEISTKSLSAEQIVNKLKENNSNIGKIVVYNEETDLNKLLSRPNQYISKVTFEDKRIEQIELDEDFSTEEERNEPTGGTVEVFKNKADMESRKRYIEQISGGSSMFAQYIYSSNYALLRLDSDLTPSQAKEYEEAFYKIMENN